MTTWPAAFALTIAVEVPLVVAIAPAALRRRAALDAAVLNAFTQPLAWLAVGTFPSCWTEVELAVLLFETCAYARITGLSWPRALAAGGLANLCTAALSFLPWP